MKIDFTVDRNLESYVKCYKGYIGEYLCNKLLEDFKQASWNTHQWYDSPTDETVDDIPNQPKDTLLETMASRAVRSLIKDGFNKYAQELEFPWFSSINNCTDLQFHKYENNHQMYGHCDHIHSIFDGEKKGVPILTSILLLNQDFEGGEFVLWEEHIQELSQGDLLIFPSNFLYPHGVLSVKNGIRYSAVCWAW